jgi:aspartyl-tRNA(Asn)/glutamyl-tRNA(Gln) amidotransferase subunit B
VGRERVDRIRESMPELPDARRRRFVHQYALPEYDANLLTQSRAIADFFERTVASGAPAKASSNWIMGELTRVLNERNGDITSSPVSAGGLAELLVLVERGTISGSIAKAVFEKMIATGRPAADIVAAEGLTQIDDDEHIAALVADVIANNPEVVGQYRSGKTNAFGFLVGQVMKGAGGKANPRRVNELLKRAL